MKKILNIVLFCAINMVAFADQPYVLRDQPTHDTLAVFDMTDPAFITVEVELLNETNRIEINQVINAYTTAWYGPDWPQYKSTLSDENGYCWWTCPEFDASNRITAVIASGGGTNNHIGMIIPKGKYRITFDRKAIESSDTFILERLSSTGLSLPQTHTNMAKIVLNGHLLIKHNGILYNAYGARVK